MKKIKGILIAITLLMMSNFLGISEVEASQIEVENMKIELKETFPEYSDYITNLDSTNQVYGISMFTNTEEEAEIIFSETRQYDKDTEYSLVLFDDGTYASVQSWLGNAHWSGGTTQSGSGYSNTYNRRLVVYYNVAKFPMLIDQLSYSYIYGGYDSFINKGYASLNAAFINPYPFKTKENSSGPAYVGFSGENELLIESIPTYMYVEIRLGSDAIKVFLNNQQIL